MRHLWRLRPYLSIYRWQIGFSILLLLSLTALQLVLPRIIQLVIDVGLTQGKIGYLINAASLILGLGLLIAALTYGQSYLSEWIAAHIGFDLRNNLYDHIQKLSFAFHDHAQTGQLISRCIEDVRSIERFTGYAVVDLIRLLILLAGIITLLLIENSYLALIALIPLAPLILMTTNFGRKVGVMFLHVDNTLGDLSARLQENVLGVQVVRAFARETYEIERYGRVNRKLYQARINVISQWSRIMPTSHFLVTLGTILILWFGGRMVLDGRMTIGEVVAFNSYLLMLTSPAQQLTWLVNLAGEAVAGVQRSFEILDIPPEIETPPNAVILPPLAGKVEFREVCLRYQGEKIPAVEEINLTVQPNQIVALIGPTGSGKSSLVNLIPRFYDATSGSVLVDGIDVRQVDLVSLRRQIGIVMQTSLLFSASIHDNIAYGKPSASRGEVIAAAQAAQSDQFIRNLPEGYDTIVGERGVTLSGGQRQRIAIARALLMDPRILILDDSTSSVDTQTENLIQQALIHLMEGRTTFIIAHRLSSVRRADQILVLDDGHIVERGRHQDLIKESGLYREIYELQLRDQEGYQTDISKVSDLLESQTAFGEAGVKSPLDED